MGWLVGDNVDACETMCAVTRQEDAADTSQFPSNKSPSKPVAGVTKAPSGLNEMILSQHRVMFSPQRGDGAVPVEPDTVKPPVPVFRKRHQATAASTRYDNQVDEVPGALSSELSVTVNKVHRRSHSSSATDTLRPTDLCEPSPPAKIATTNTAADKSEPVEKTVNEKLAEKPSVKAKATQKSKLAVKLSTKAETQQSKVEKLCGKLSIAAKADEQTVGTSDVEIKPSFRATAEKPKPPAKTGLVTEKVESAIKSNSSPVITKRGLSEPGSKQQHVEAVSGKSVSEKGNRFPGLEIPKVKLRSTSPTSATASCQTARSDGALNVVGVETANVSESEGKQAEKSGELVASEQMKASGSLTTAKLESDPDKNRSQLQVTLKSVAKSENGSTKEVGNESTESCLNKSVTSSRKIVSDQTLADTERHAQQSAGSKSEQSGQTSTAKDINSSESTETFVPVSKRATIFGASSSSGRQFVGKSTGSAAKASALDRNVQADSSQSTDVGSGEAKTVASRVASFGACASDTRTKATVSSVAAAEDGDERNKCVYVSTESVQPAKQDAHASEAKNEIAVSAAAVGRWPPQAKSENISVEKPMGKTTAAQCAEKSKVADKAPSKAEVSAEKQVERSDEKSLVVTGAVQQAVGKTNVPWVKPPGTSLHSSLKSQSRGSMDESKSRMAEPDKTASNASVVSQKQSSVPSSVKSSGISSSKYVSKDISGGTAEPGKVGGGCLSAQSEKQSSSSRSGAKTATTVVAVETTSSVPKIMSTSVEFTSSKRTIDGDVSTPPVTSTEPPWLAMARAKTRVWTEGKI